MKNKWLPVIVLLALGIAAYFSCRKTNFNYRAPSISYVELKERFYYENRVLDPFQRQIAEFIKQKDKIPDFLQQTIEKAGFPQWEKMQKNFQNHAQNERTGSQSDSLIIIPFAKDSQRYVNTALVLQIKNSDTTITWLCDWQYKTQPYSVGSIGSGSAEKLALFFMILNLNTFNHRDFAVKDSSLFKGLSRFSHTSRNNVILPRKIHLDTDSASSEASRALAGSPPIYNWVLWYNNLIDTYGFSNLFNGIPNTGILIPGGGSGNGGVMQTPPDCRQVTGRTDCSTGWVVMDNNDLSPSAPPNDSTIAHQLKRLIQKAGNVPDSLHNIAQQDNKERTFTFAHTTTGDTAVMWIRTGTSHTSMTTLTPYSIASFHTHYEDDPVGGSDRNQCFDGPDIFKLYKNAIVGGLPVHVAIISTRDYYYAAVITDPVKFKSYIIGLCGTDKISIMQYALNEIHISAMDACTTQPQCNWQKKSELGTLAIVGTGNSNLSGIKVFRSPRQNINFTLLTP